MILFQIDKQTIFFWKIQHPPHGFYLIMALIFGINKDVIQIYNDINSEFFGQDLIDITLKADWSVG